MRWIMLLVLASTMTALTGCATPSMTTGDLVGRWDVNLQETDADPKATTVMVIEDVEGGALVGTFYGAPFVEGRVKALHRGVWFSFVTEDGSGPYLTSGHLHPGGAIRGMTNSTGRDFLNIWTAQRAEGGG